MLILWFSTTSTAGQDLLFDAENWGTTAHGTQTLVIDDSQEAWPDVEAKEPEEVCQGEFAQNQLGRGQQPQPSSGRPYNAYVRIRRGRVRERGIGHQNFRSRAERGVQRWGRKRPR